MINRGMNISSTQSYWIELENLGRIILILIVIRNKSVKASMIGHPHDTISTYDFFKSARIILCKLAGNVKYLEIEPQLDLSILR